MLTKKKNNSDINKPPLILLHSESKENQVAAKLG